MTRKADSYFSAGVDTWFDKIVENPCLSDKFVQRLDYISKLKPTRQNFLRFYEDSFAVQAPWACELRTFVSQIDKGIFRPEFRLRYGDHSQTSELFSLFQQAIHYRK